MAHFQIVDLKKRVTVNFGFIKGVPFLEPRAVDFSHSESQEFDEEIFLPEEPNLWDIQLKRVKNIRMKNHMNINHSKILIKLYLE